MRRILWDVDTQVDFMLPDGKLYVPTAEETAPAMSRLVEAARAAVTRRAIAGATCSEPGT